jgi:hypothetical protein
MAKGPHFEKTPATLHARRLSGHNSSSSSSSSNNSNRMERFEMAQQISVKVGLGATVFCVLV